MNKLSLIELVRRVRNDLFLIEKHIVDDLCDGRRSLTVIEAAVLVLEDHRYLNHRGIDWYSVLREVLKALFGQRHGGASTIEMQFVRTVTGLRERTLRRKLYEMLLAYIVVSKFGKQRILNAYLACAYFGSGLHGIEKACLANFSKRPDQLIKSEALFVAATLVYPRPVIPTQNWRNKVERRAAYGERVYCRLKR